MPGTRCRSGWRRSLAKMAIPRVVQRAKEKKKRTRCVKDLFIIISCVFFSCFLCCFFVLFFCVVFVYYYCTFCVFFYFFLFIFCVYVFILCLYFFLFCLYFVYIMFIFYLHFVYFFSVCYSRGRSVVETGCVKDSSCANLYFSLGCVIYIYG